MGYGEPAWVPPPEVLWPGGFISRKVIESRRVDVYRVLALGRALTHARVDVAESGIISPFGVACHYYRLFFSPPFYYFLHFSKYFARVVF